MTPFVKFLESFLHHAIRHYPTPLARRVSGGHTRFVVSWLVEMSFT